MITKLLAAATLMTLCAFVAEAQTPPLHDGDSVPIYHVTVVSRTLSAVNYQHRSGPTEIDFKFDRLEAPQRFGREYLIYVLWAITPEGRALNLAEVMPGRSDKADLH